MKNYTLKQLEQLSRAGGDEDVGSTSSRSNATSTTPLTHSGIFSRLLRSTSSGSADLPNQDTNINLPAATLITDLDYLTNNEDQQQISEPVFDEDSRSSAVDVEWENRPERAIHENGRQDFSVHDYDQYQPEHSFTNSDVQDADPAYQPGALPGEEDELADCEPDENENTLERINQEEQHGRDQPENQVVRVTETEVLDIQISRKKVADKHKLRDPCTCKRLQCYRKITEDERKLIWREFWAMDYSSQRLFIAANMTANEIKQRRPREEAESHVKRAASYTYHFGTSIALTEVCKEMFLSTLGFRSDKVLTVCRSTTTAIDQRGRSRAPGTRGNNRFQLTTAQLNAVNAHIKSYNPGISHYRRKHAPKRLYLDPSLTVQDMYQDYKDKNGTNPVSQSTYYR